MAKVGAAQWFTYDDGLQVQVTKLTRFSKGVIATVTIKNGTKQTFDAALTSVRATGGPNGEELKAEYDMDLNVGLGFTGSIPPGRTKTARYGFAATKAQQKQIGVEVEPGLLDYESCHFDGWSSSSHRGLVCGGRDQSTSGIDGGPGAGRRARGLGGSAFAGGVL